MEMFYLVVLCLIVCNMLVVRDNAVPLTKEDGLVLIYTKRTKKQIGLPVHRPCNNKCIFVNRRGSPLLFLYRE